MKKNFFCILLATIFFTEMALFTSCSETDEDYNNESICYTAKMTTSGVYIYGDLVFYYDSGDNRIEYQSISSPNEDGGTYIYSDPLASDSEDPLSGGGSTYFFLVDYEASDKNKNSPILIIAYNYYVFDSSGYYVTSLAYRIVSYDVMSNEITIIKDEIYDSIQSLQLCGNYIVYTTNDGEEGYNVYSIKKDGSEYSALDNPECNLYRVETIYEGYVYFYDAAYELYRAPLDLSEKEYLFDIAAYYINSFVEDGYLIYCDNLTKNDSGLSAVDVCRRPLSDLTAEPETLITNVCLGMEFRDNFYYYLSEARVKDDITYIDYNTLYVYSFETMSSSVAWDFEDFYGVYMGFLDDCIVYKEDGVNILTAYNINTGEESEIPY
ncbi:MAG: DUF5050 domain-containing protein [Firmicutes bacterium]|nr:DUF5050 domain-containing protein [Bacillota bacterium]